METAVAFTQEQVISKIYSIRGKRVMLDFDLAELYGVETKQLKRQVKRNMKRFPEDFMFELSLNEVNNLRCQIGTSSWGGIRYSPMAFTEQGVAMLSGILSSDRAIAVNIQIMRAYTRFREVLAQHSEILLKLEQLEKRIEHQDGRIDGHEEDTRTIFEVLKQLINKPNEERKPIGFKT